MKKNTSRSSVIFYGLLLLSSVIGALLGSLIYGNERLANGILGCFTVYLIFIQYIKPGTMNSEINELEIKFPESIKYILLCGVLSVIAYIALKNAIGLFSLL